MSYTAIEKMRKENKKRFGKDVGPFLPKPFPREARGMDLKSAVLRFLDKRCVDLRRDAEIEKLETKKGYQGSSLRPNQIPYNMQMDLDRLCLKNEIAKFIDSGVAEDAYTVYYSFIEMFIGKDGKSQSMVELLSEFESNASSLLMSHRDHYSHSVYVFALGLAIFETNDWFRKVFSTAYRFKDGGEGKESACAFLEYWGLTALFHDIGYPFEIPFEQILAYFEVDQKKKKRGTDSVYIAYQNVKPLIKIENEDRARLAKLYNGENFEDVAELLSFGITQRLGKAYKFTNEFMDQKIRSKPTHPEKNNYFMDHAFFSACRLYQELVRILKPENLQKYHVDAITAIMLHNSLFKFAIVGYKSDDLKAPLKAKLHPLAWMLMLCDELQCWDRTAYGRNSRDELHPMAVDFSFADQQIHAMYYYDKDEKDKILAYKKQYQAWKDEGGSEEEKPRLQFLVLVVLPKLIVTMMDFVPSVEHTVADVGTQLVDIFLGHGLTAQVDPLAEALAFHASHDGFHIGLGMSLQVMQQGVHGVVGNHVAIGVIGLQGLVDDHLAPAFLYLFSQNLKLVHGLRLVVEQVLATLPQVIILVLAGVFAFGAEVGLSHPDLQQLAGFNSLFDGIRSQGLKLDVLDFAFALVAFQVFRCVACDGVHVVHPPVGRHEMQLVFGRIVAHKAERQLDVHLVGIVGLTEQRERSELRRVLHAGAESRPEAARSHDFAISGAAVVVGADGRTSGHVALTHHAS